MALTVRDLACMRNLNIGGRYMDVKALMEIADDIEARMPEYMDLGGHKVCAEIRKLKEQFRELLNILIVDQEDKNRKKKKKAS